MGLPTFTFRIELKRNLIERHTDDQSVVTLPSWLGLPYSPFRDQFLITESREENDYTLDGASRAGSDRKNNLRSNRSASRRTYV